MKKESRVISDIEELIGSDLEITKEWEARFKCDYENCERILVANRAKPFKCTACGHGHMQIEKPKAYCCECGGPIYFNVGKDCEVVCDKCTALKVAEIEELEKQVGFEIRNKQDYILAKRLLETREEDEQSRKTKEERGKKVILTTISKKKRRKR